MDANQNQTSAAELTSMLVHATETLATIQGIEVGFFERIPDNQPITLQELSGQMGYDIRLVERWLRFALAAGYVNTTANGYTLTSKGMLLRNASPQPNILGLHHLIGYFMNVLPYSKDAYRTGVGFDSLTRGVIGKDFIPRVSSPLAKMLVDYFKQAGLSDGHSILDLGCGDGSMLREIVNSCAGVSATGIDINPHTIELGKKKTREAGLQDQVQLLTGDVMDLAGIPDHAFDWVSGINLLHFIPLNNRDTVLREMVRISRYGVFCDLFITNSLGICASNILLSTLFTDFTGFLSDEEADTLIRNTGIRHYAFLPILHGGSRLAILLTDADHVLVSRLQQLIASDTDALATRQKLSQGPEVLDGTCTQAGEKFEESNERSERFPPTLQGPRKDRQALESLNKKLELQVAEKTENLAHAYERLQLSNQSLESANQELKTINRKQREIDRIKSDFVSVVSHELRTPLTSIKAFAEMMLMKPDMPTDTRDRLLQIIDKESDRLSRLINDVLDLTKIESGKLSWRIEQLSIQDIIETTVAGIRSLVDNKGLTIAVHMQPPLPLIFGDRDRLIQVINNLLSNAIKFTPQGGSILVSTRSEERPQPHAVISLSDTGMGIRNDDLERIFEKFHRSGDMLAENTEGAGLGLTISRQIVEYHGGAIQVASTLGKGSTFTVTLPLNKIWKREDHEEALQNIDLFERPR